MRGKIRIDGRKNVETNKGFPIIIYLTQRGERPKTILTGYHSHKEHWDKDNALPLKKHPDYYNLLDYLQIKKIELNKLLDESKKRIITLHEAENILANIPSGIFYEDAMKIAKDLTRPYQIPLISFNKYFPNYPYESITKKTAQRYVDILLSTPIETKNTFKKRSVNGVISYMDSLTALWNKLEIPNNPFSGVRPVATPTKDKDYSIQDLKNIVKNLDLLKDKKGSIGSHRKYMIYNLLCFYLGGIDLLYLKEMRYDKHVVNGRIEFYRRKGSRFVKVSNKIFPEAEKLLKEFDCYPYLVPLYKLKNYDGFIPNISRDFDIIKDKLQISKKPYSKAPRYTFINIGQDLLIDERIMKQIVGHSQNSTHSIYKRELPYHIIDEAHERIISVIAT